MEPPTGALQGQAEDSVTQRKLSEPGASQTCTKVWPGWSKPGVAA